MSRWRISRSPSRRGGARTVRDADLRFGGQRYEGRLFRSSPPERLATRGPLADGIARQRALRVAHRGSLVRMLHDVGFSATERSSFRRRRTRGGRISAGQPRPSRRFGSTQPFPVEVVPELVTSGQWPSLARFRVDGVHNPTGIGPFSRATTLRPRVKASDQTDARPKRSSPLCVTAWQFEASQPSNSGHGVLWVIPLMSAAYEPI